MIGAEISVLMSVYNGQPYLPMAVESILQQTYKNFEFIIINDGSTDDSLDYLKSLKDERIRLFDQENKGLGAALNFGLGKVRTMFVARMDCDDIAIAHRLEKQIKKMRSEPELVMLGTGIAFTLDGHKTAFPPPLPANHKAIHSVLSKGGHAISHPTIMCKTEILREIGGYRINGVGQDWDLFLRMCEAGKVANLPEVLLYYRLHESSNAWKSSDKTVMGKKFAVDSAYRRSRGEQELTYEDFIKTYNRPGGLKTIQRKVLSFSDNAYRVAILSALKSNYPKMILALSISVMTTPKKLYLYMKKRFLR